jgi:2-polyprenyl-3-methyl-5-hydroxy-6-metoxy-1,4-benzoquinol methylase
MDTVTPHDADISALPPSDARSEIDGGDRFAFGHNWRRFLELVDEKRIAAAEESLRTMLGRTTLEGLRFLDIGCGSGLFSLAARRLGARVHSLDFDPESVACAVELQRRFAPRDPLWTIEQGSALDRHYLDRLGTHDIVYSWGVLHHTGDMWTGLELAGGRVAPGGRLFIAIYNDAGGSSRRWKLIKHLYNRLPPVLRWPLVLYAMVRMWSFDVVKGALRGRPFAFLRHPADRGMSPWRDLFDWLGGYPYQYAKPEEIFEYYNARGFALRKLKTAVNYGINEFVFERIAAGPVGE